MPIYWDGFTRVTRPYPNDAPTLVTLWNPPCACGHAMLHHDYTGDEHETSYGSCEADGCDCENYEAAE